MGRERRARRAGVVTLSCNWRSTTAASVTCGARAPMIFMALRGFSSSPSRSTPGPSPGAVPTAAAAERMDWASRPPPRPPRPPLPPILPPPPIPAPAPAPRGPHPALLLPLPQPLPLPPWSGSSTPCLEKGAASAVAGFESPGEEGARLPAVGARDGGCVNASGSVLI